jgi:hypothetical protein
MLLLKINYGQKTMFIILVFVAIGIFSLILHILDLIDSWKKVYFVRCSWQLQETVFVRKVLI